jgi:hypothetical protein
VLAAQLERLSAELAGAGTEQAGEGDAKPLTTKDTKEHKGGLEKPKPYRGSTRMNADQKKLKGKNLTTEARRRDKIGKEKPLTTKDTKEHKGKIGKTKSKKSTAEGGGATRAS